MRCSRPRSASAVRPAARWPRTAAPATPARPRTRARPAASQARLRARSTGRARGSRARTVRRRPRARRSARRARRGGGAVRAGRGVLDTMRAPHGGWRAWAPSDSNFPRHRPRAQESVGRPGRGTPGPGGARGPGPSYRDRDVRAGTGIFVPGPGRSALGGPGVEGAGWHRPRPPCRGRGGPARCGGSPGRRAGRGTGFGAVPRSRRSRTGPGGATVGRRPVDGRSTAGRHDVFPARRRILASYTLGVYPWCMFLP